MEDKTMRLLLGLVFLAISVQMCTGNEFYHLDDVKFEEDDHPHDKCTRRRMDVIFILDESSSIPPATFRKEKRFVAEMMKQFDIGSDGTRIGLLTFADNTRIHFNLRDYGRRWELWERIKKIRQFGGNTNTGEALRILRTYAFRPAQGARLEGDIPQICIVVTDGNSQRHDLTKLQALHAKAKGFIMFSVGVGPQTNEEELRNIASNIDYILEHEDHVHVAEVSCDATPEPPLQIIPGCKDKPIDLVFLLDNSNSIPHSSYEKMMQFVSDLVMGFNIGKDATRVALIKFASDASLEFTFNTYYDRDEAALAVRAARRIHGGTYTYYALKMVETDVLTEEHGARPGIPKVGLIITDGNSANRRHTLWQAKVLREKLGVRFFAIGVGHSIDINELIGIVGEHNKKDVFMAKSYDFLVEFRETMVLNACGDSPTRPPPTTPKPINIQPGCHDKKADVVFLIDSSSSVTSADYEKMLTFVSYYVQSLDVGTDTRVGVIMYASSVRTVMDLGSYSRRASAGRAVENIRRLRGTTNTAAAIKELYQMINRMRPDALRVGILITDGGTDDNAAALKEAQQARDLGILLFALGIGSNSDKPVLKSIVGNQDRLVYTANNFNSLPRIAEGIIRATCRAQPLAPKPTEPPRMIYDVCKGKELDVFFMIDSSSKISNADWKHMVRFVEGMAWGMDISRYDTHVAVIPFANKATVAFGLNRYYTRRDATKAILGISRPSGRGRNTADALVKMRQYSAEGYGGRKGAVKVGIVVTVGLSDQPQRTAQEAKTSRDDLGFVLFSVGSADFDFNELESIVDIPHSETRLFTTFRVDRLPTHEEAIVTTACKATPAVKKYDITLTNDFTPRSSNPIAIKDKETELQFDLKIQNIESTDIPAKRRGRKNYAVDFYFSQDDLRRTPIARTSVVKLDNKVEPGTEFKLIGKGPASKLITYTTSGTLPDRQCNKYVWFCGCVREGQDADYKDKDKTNNCQCRPASELISCSPDITVNRFDPNWRGVTFKKGEPVDLTGFNYFVKNSARKEPGNDIKRATGGDNYAVDLYFAEDDLSRNPRATRSQPFPTTTTRGDLSVPLDALDQTSKLYAKALVTLPVRNCERFVWLCACVREGSAAKYVDSNKNNNCECKDVSPQARCKEPDPDITLTNDFTPRSSNPIAVKNKETELKFDLKISNVGDESNIPSQRRGKKNYAVDFYFSQDDLTRTPISRTSVVKLDNTVEPGTEFGLIGNGPASKLVTYTTKGTLPERQCGKYVWFCGCVREGRDADYNDKDKNNNCQCRRAEHLIQCNPDLTVSELTTDDRNKIFQKDKTSNLAFDLKIKDIDGSDVTRVNRREKNYALDFYVSQDNLENVPVTDTTAFLLKTIKEPLLDFGLVAKGEASKLLSFVTSGKLPSQRCNEYVWFCACVREGSHAKFTDTDKSNNCRCQDAKKKISCSPDIKVRNFDPKPTPFVRGEETEITNIDLNIMNGGSPKPGNDIQRAKTGDNFEIAMHFAKDDLAKNPAAKKTPPFPATLKTGDLSVALEATKLTPQQKFKAKVLLPDADDCAQYLWLCACVKEGSGAEYEDSNRNNNCECKDVSPFVKCVLLPEKQINDGCVGKKADVFFLAESTSSISNDDFTEILSFIQMMTLALDVSAANTHVGVIVFADNAAVAIQLDKYYDRAAAALAIPNVKRQPGRGRSTAEAISLMQQYNDPKYGGRPGALKAGIIITTGLSDTPDATRAEAKKARDAGYAMFAVGADNFDFNELEGIVDIPHSETRMFTVFNYNRLVRHEPAIISELCRTNPPPVTTCRGKPVDVVFVIDNSNSIASADYNTMMRFVETLIGSFDVGPDKTQIGVVTYASDSLVRFELNKYYDAAVIVEFIHNMRRQYGGTQTGAALKEAREHTFEPEHGARPAVPKIALVITDGVSANRRQTLSEAALTRDKGIRVFAVGIGKGIDMTELQGIAGVGNDDQVFSAESFEALLGLNEKIVRTTCDAEAPPPSPDLVMNDFTPRPNNPVMKAGEETRLDMDVILQNKAGSDIKKVGKGEKNYALDFYVSQANLEITPVADTTAVLLKNINEPGLDFGLVSKGSASDLLRFTTSGTLPVKDCTMYVWLCACAREGSDAVYTDSDKTNNCKCQDSSEKITCAPDIQVSNFQPKVPADTTFKKGEEVELTTSVLKVKNSAAGEAGNNIKKATTGDNFAIDMYFAQADLAINPRATRSKPFPAAVVTGDLSVALKSTSTTAQQTVKSKLTLPTKDCELYLWLCACVREGSGAEYKDSNRNNNCECKDVKAQTKCAEEKVSCQGMPVDVVFIVDNSNSIRNNDYKTMIDFIESLISSFDVGVDKARIGMVTYASDPNVRFELNKYYDSAVLVHTVDTMRRQYGGTQTGAALAEARDHTFEPEHGARPGVDKFAIVITDGVSADRKQTLSEAKKVRDKGIKVFAVGIGPGVDMEELRGIAGEENPDHVFSAQSFEALQALNERIIKETCAGGSKFKFLMMKDAPAMQADQPRLSTSVDDALKKDDALTARKARLHKMFSSITVKKNVPVCETLASDVVFILDNSAGVTRQDFREEINFVKSVIREFNLGRGTNKTRVAVVLFGNAARVGIFLNENRDFVGYARDLHGLRRLHGRSNLAAGLYTTRVSALSTFRGARWAAKKLIVLVTAGRSSNRARTETEAARLHAEGIETVAIGVGKRFSISELNSVVGKSRHNRLLTIENFRSLPKIKDDVVNARCNRG